MDKNAGTEKTVTVSDVTISDGNNGNNYNVTYQDNTSSAITRRALSLVADKKEITEGEATPTTWSGKLTGFVAGEGLGANDVYFFALDNPAATAAGSYSVTGMLSIDGDEAKASGDYGDNYTFANAAANATAFTINAYIPPAPEPKPTPEPTPKPQDIVEKITGNPGAAKEYTDVLVSLESGKATANLPMEQEQNGLLPAQQTDNGQPAGNAQESH